MTPVQIRHVWGAMGAVALALWGCGDGAGGTDVGNPVSQQEQLFDEGVEYLEQGEYEEARDSFAQLVDEPGYECEAQYGIVLAGVQDTAARLDTLADAAAVFLGAAPGFRPAQSVDILPLVQNLLEPFEEFFTDILGALDQVVASGCSVTVPGGMPIEVGDPDSLIYFKARFGYEFDPAAARVGQILFSSALAGIRSALAHNLELDADQLQQTANTVAEAARGVMELTVNGPGDVTITTVISSLRALGAIPEAHPNLLKLADADRFAQIDNDLTLALRAFYARQGNAESGVLASLLETAARDTDPTDNFLGFADDNSNGVVDEGDQFIIGLRELHVTGVFSEPSIEGGVRVNLSGGLGDIGTIIDTVHDVVDVVGDQLASVDDEGQDFVRLGMAPVNDLIEAVTVLDVFLTPLPEALEVDLGAYFKEPGGVRELFPYWVDDDGDDDTPRVFLVEGEGWITNATEPWVSFGDAAHFSGSWTFADGGDTVALDAITIAADGIAPPTLSLLVATPLPYVAWQDPSFRGVLYIDESRLYGALAGARRGMHQANLRSVNTAVASYVAFVYDEWVRME